MDRILVALDGSPRAAAVLDAAIDLARKTGAKLRLFRAIPVQPEIPWDLVREFPAGGLEALLSQHARSELEERARAVPPALLDEVATGIGVPWSSILEAARAWNADLVVLGSHGYGIVDRILGTTAAKVVNHADRDVLVVRHAA